jgi:hypothetical protein
LLEMGGMPPVKDIEGTPAPRKPLAHHAIVSKQETPSAPKKRGRPPKNQTKNQIPTDAQPSSSSEDETPEGTPKETPEDALAEVTAI